MIRDKGGAAVRYRAYAGAPRSLRFEELIKNEKPFQVQFEKPDSGWQRWGNAETWDEALDDMDLGKRAMPHRRKWRILHLQAIVVAEEQT